MTTKPSIPPGLASDFTPPPLSASGSTPRFGRDEAPPDGLQTELRHQIGLLMNRETFYCEFGEFNVHYMPPSPEESDFQFVIDWLLERGHMESRETASLEGLAPYILTGCKITPVDAKRAYLSQIQTNSTIDKVDEGTLFAFLETLVGAILEALTAAEHTRGNDFSLRLCPNNRLGSDKIDACATKRMKGKLRVTDIAVPFEFKIYESDKMQRPDLLVKVLVSFFCATEAELGYNPHISYLGDEGYLYEFPQGPNRSQARYFKTTQSVTECRGLRLAGRSTRVWKVLEVQSKTNRKKKLGSEEMIVKDVWIDANAESEAEIQRRVVSDIGQFADQRNWWKHPLLEHINSGLAAELFKLLKNGRFKKLFLTAIEEHSGEGSKDVAEKAWLTKDIFLKRSLVPIEPGPTTQRLPPVREQKGQDTGPQRFTRPKDPPYRSFSPKRRWFFAYNEVCHRLSDLPTLGDAMDVLRQNHLVLLLMFCAGWVHRDISTGNILAILQPKGWSVRLSDLEFAKKFPPETPASFDPKIGTLFFMAYEVHSGATMYNKVGEHTLPFGRPDKGNTVSLVIPPFDENAMDSDDDDVPEHNPSRVDDDDEDDDDDSYVDSYAGDNMSVYDGPDNDDTKAVGLESNDGAIEVDDDGSGSDKDVVTSNVNKQGVIYNLQHDVESEWWIIIYLITMCVGHAPSIEVGTTIFQELPQPSIERRDNLRFGLQSQLKQSLHHKLKAFLQPLEALRNEMVTAYLRRAPDQVSDLSTYSIPITWPLRFFNEMNTSRSLWGSMPLQGPKATLSPPGQNLSEEEEVTSYCRYRKQEKKVFRGE
ncbi:hypothetical protein H1R20_g27, partial [Candolleomyces eurysporus]